MQTNEFDTPTRQKVIQYFEGSVIVASPAKAQGLVESDPVDFVKQSCDSSDSCKTANQDEYKSPDESKMRQLQIKKIEQYPLEHCQNQNETPKAINLQVQKVSGSPSLDSAEKLHNQAYQAASETHFEGQAPYKLDQFKALGHIQHEAGQRESDLVRESDQQDGLAREQSSQHSKMSDEKSSDDINKGRGKRRSCTKNIPNYSNLHKGVLAGSALKEVISSAEKLREPSPTKQQISPQTTPEQKENLSNAEELVGQIIKLRSFEEICAIFDSLASFDWDLKDIKNLKHSPDKELTQVVYWFWINSQYFPYNAQIQAKNDFESMFKSKVLNNIRHSPSLVPDDADMNCDQDPDGIEKLYVEDKFIQFRELLISTTMTNPQFTSIDDYIADLQGNLQNQEATNLVQLQQKLQIFKTAYSNIPDEPDREPYSAKNMLNYGHDFIEKIDYRYVEDIQQNLQWYLQNSSEILLNVNYPSRTEKEFLRQLEMWQQQKNDINYTLILQQLQQSEEKQTNLTEDIRYGQLSAHKRGLVVQEDAQCAICNNGDYEDEDLIVFCGICNIPVHQKCYGIDEIPDTDWICNNCSCFAMKRGLQVKCLLCPKRGGAMKPTSLFTSQDHYQRYYTAAAKKKGLSSTTFLTMNHTQVVAPEPTDSEQANKAYKQDIFEREDKNHALSQILNRECNFQDALISQKRLNGENFAQDLIDLHFLQSEMLTEIPEDYIFFLQRNQKVLESGLVQSTETLYEWVHLSCAIWTPGPIVTPKTPVRMSKIDQKRFSLQCIICGKKNDGACIQCQHSKCMISFHIECARRANYFMEIEKGTDREQFFRIFCEKHRPFKIVKELEERDRQTVEEVYKFAKVINKCAEISQRAEEKYLRIKKFSPFTKQAQCQKKKTHSVMKPVETKKKEKLNLAKEKQLQRIEMLEEKKSQKLQRDFEKNERERQRQMHKVHTKKWKEKDKKMLFEQVKTKYLQLMKLRMNLVMIDPQQKQKKKLERDKKRVQTMAQQETKKRNKKLVQKDSTRDGLRARPNQTQQELHQTEMLLFEEADPSEIEEDTAFYRWCNPVFLQELDWCITLSKYEFCWQDVAFKEFTAKDCYEKYVSSVRDTHSFLKKVLLGGGAMREKYKKLLANQLNQPDRFFQPETEEEEAADHQKDFCVCRGAVTSGFFVACDAEDDCPYGGWLHPECTDSLALMTKENINDFGTWYCPACQIRINEEELQEPEEEGKDEDDLAQIEKELLACAEEAQKIQNDLDEEEEEEQDSDDLMSHDVSLSEEFGHESD